MNNEEIQRGSVVFFQQGPGVGPITNNNFRIAKKLIRSGRRVTLLGTAVEANVYSSAPDNVIVKSLDAKRSIGVIWPLIKYLRSAKPDMLMASGPWLHVASGIARAITGYPRTLAWRIHAHTSSLLEDRSYANRKMLELLMRSTKRRADYLISPSQVAAEDWAETLREDVGKVRIMYHPSIDDELIRGSGAPLEHRWLEETEVPVVVSVARLEEQKSIDVLLMAFERVRRSRDVKLIIVGEGSLRAHLEAMAADLGVAEDVDFVGHASNPMRYMARATVFVLSSKYEGFPNVLPEALACGRTVVSTDSPSGPREILKDGQYGYLVPVGDFVAMSQAMEKAIDHPLDPDILKERADRFHVDRIVRDVDDILSCA